MLFRTETTTISTKTQFEVEFWGLLQDGMCNIVTVSVIPFWYQKNWQIPRIYCIIASEDEK